MAAFRDSLPVLRKAAHLVCLGSFWVVCVLTLGAQEKSDELVELLYKEINEQMSALFSRFCGVVFLC